MDRDQIELDDEPIRVERRPRAGVVLSIRISGEELEQLQRLAESKGMTISQLGRQAITAFIGSGGASTPEGRLPPTSWTGTVTGAGTMGISFRGPHATVRTMAAPAQHEVSEPKPRS